VRHVALARRLVEVLELLPGELRVLGEVEVPAVGDALELDQPMGNRYSMSAVPLE
jgi:hypothetical protein